MLYFRVISKIMLNLKWEGGRFGVIFPQDECALPSEEDTHGCHTFKQVRGE